MCICVEQQRTIYHIILNKPSMYDLSYVWGSLFAFKNIEYESGSRLRSLRRITCSPLWGCSPDWPCCFTLERCVAAKPSKRGLGCWGCAVLLRGLGYEWSQEQTWYEAFKAKVTWTLRQWSWQSCNQSFLGPFQICSSNKRFLREQIAWLTYYIFFHTGNNLRSSWVLLQGKPTKERRLVPRPKQSGTSQT